MYKKRFIALLCVCASLSALALNALDVQGSRICLFELYSWTEGAGGQVTVAPNDLFYSGGWSTNVVAQGDELICEGGFTMFGVTHPFKVDYAAGTVTLEAGDEPFATKSGSVTTSTGTTTTTVDTTLSYYLVNEDWLVNYGSLQDVTGTIEADGSIVINGGFAYYIEKSVTTTVRQGGRVETHSDTTFSISLIMRNARLLKPNGVHEYTSVADGVTHTSEVYIKQSGDTVYVLNLYGMGWPQNYMVLNSDNLMSFPGQPFADIADAEYPGGEGLWYNAHNASGALGNEGEVIPAMITWGLTIPYDKNRTWDGWNNNRLHYTNGSTFVVPSAQTAMRGDVNGDGDVTIADVTVLIDYLLSGDATGIVLENADCNQDTDVTIADVTALIDYLLSGVW